MKAKNGLSENLVALLQVHDEVYVSLILPTWESRTDKRVFSLQAEKAINEARAYLEQHYNKELAESLPDLLDQLYRHADYEHFYHGIGFFASSHGGRTVYFNTPVAYNLAIGQSFDLKDVFYEEQFSIPYLVLHVSEKSAEVYLGRNGSMEEIHLRGFPLLNSVQYEYTRPSRGSSYVGNAFSKDYEKDKSVMEEMRVDAFFRKVESTLKEHFGLDQQIVLAGTTENVALFEEGTDLRKNLVGTVKGNYGHALPSLAEKAWGQYCEHVSASRDKFIVQLKENAGRDMQAQGIREAWKMLQSGRGAYLLVEKQAAVPAFMKKGDDIALRLKKPEGTSGTMANIVDDLVMMAIEKNTQIIVTDKGKLNATDGVLVIARY